MTEVTEAGLRALGPRYMGVDYSGALTPTASLNGLRVYVAECDAVPAEVAPPPSLRKYWTRRGIAEWLRICTVWRTA